MTTVYYMGDSFCDTAMTTPMAAILGWTVSATNGVGGTGYVNTGLGTAYPSRLSTLISAAPDVVVIEGGGNDPSVATTGEFTTAVAALFATLRASLPNVPLFVTGGHRIDQSYFDILVTQTRLARGVFVDWGDVVEVARSNCPRWLTGTGKVGSTTGDGNRDVYMSSDGVHPSAAGFAYVARRFALSVLATKIGQANSSATGRQLIDASDIRLTAARSLASTRSLAATRT